MVALHVPNLLSLCSPPHLYWLLNPLCRRQSLDTLERIYAYMTFNHSKDGILTNWHRALFLRRAETDGKTLEYYLVKLDAFNTPILSILKGWG
jgi:hypothetical protein